MIFSIRKSSFVLVVIYLSTAYLFGSSTQNFPELHFTYPENKNTYGLRAGATEPTPWHNPHLANRINLAHISPADFERVFRNEPEKTVILSNYKLYAFPGFLAYARSLSCYNEFILSLQEKIKSDKKFRKETAYVEGFKYSFSFWSEKSGFHDFVNTEAKTIRNNQQVAQQQKAQAQIKNYGLNVDNQNELEALTQNYIDRIRFQPEDIIKNRLIDRANALRQTRNKPEERFDYSLQVPSIKANDQYTTVFKQTYGTALDCQLHKELCQTRNAMFELERNFDRNYHVEIIAPAVHHLAAQAKTEQRVSVAFQLADFSHALTQLVAKGLDIFYDFSSRAGKGVLKAAKNTLSLEHWQEMATGALQIGLSFFDAIGQENARQDAVLTAALSKNYDAIPELAQEHCLHTQAQKDTINHCAQETYEKIKAMSWQEIVENGTELGATIIFDTLALHALSGFTSKASRAVAERIGNVMEKGAPLAQQYALEVAGFGKVVAEEGAEAAIKAVDTVINNPGPLGQKPIRITEIISEAAEVNKKLLCNKKIISCYSNDAIKLEHIFSPNHIANGIMKLGKTEDEIVNTFRKIVSATDTNGMLKDGTNRIKTTIHGFDVEIKLHIKDGIVRSLDGYRGHSARTWQNSITWPEIKE